MRFAVMPWSGLLASPAIYGWIKRKSAGFPVVVWLHITWSEGVQQANWPDKENSTDPFTAFVQSRWFFTGLDVHAGLYFAKKPWAIHQLQSRLFARWNM